MSTRCDGCKEILDEDDGFARLMIRDPVLDYSADAPPPVIRRAPQVDVCAMCLVKLIGILGLPADTFQLRSKPKHAAPAGALSDADLAALGLKDKDT